MNGECERNQLRVEKYKRSPWIFIQCEMKPQRIYAKNVGKLQKKKKTKQWKPWKNNVNLFSIRCVVTPKWKPLKPYIISMSICVRYSTTTIPQCTYTI